jgi:hypothetical protein
MPGGEHGRARAAVVIADDALSGDHHQVRSDTAEGRHRVAGNSNFPHRADRAYRWVQERGRGSGLDRRLGLLGVA